MATRRRLAALELPLPQPLDGVGGAAPGHGPRPGPRSRSGARTRARSSTSCCRSTRLPGGSIAAGPWPHDACRSRGRATSSSTSRATRSRSRTASTTCSASSSRASRTPTGEPAFHAIWAVDEAGQVTLEAEKRAFEQAIDLMMDRLAADPSIHVYHYAPYEPTAPGRLMGRHATREEEVDRLLARRGVRGPLPRRSAGPARVGRELLDQEARTALRAASATRRCATPAPASWTSRRWLAEIGARRRPGPRSPQTDPILQRIERLQPRRLRLELAAARLAGGAARRARRDDLGGAAAAAGAGRPGRRARRSPSELARRGRSGRACWRTGCPTMRPNRTPEQHARWLLAQLLSWHRREEKSFWWRFFRLMNDLTDEERVDESANRSAASSSWSGSAGGPRLGRVPLLASPSRSTTIEVGTDVCDPATGRSPGSVSSRSTTRRGTLELRRGPKTDGPHPTLARAVRPSSKTLPLRESLLRIGEWMAAARHRWARVRTGRRAELLMRRPPDAPAGGRSPAPGETRARGGDAARPDPGRELPRGPGSARLGQDIPRRRGDRGARPARPRVGVTANSHQVIGHLLDEVAERAAARGVEVEDRPEDGRRAGTALRTRPGRSRTTRKLLAALADGEISVAGGTAWLWSRPEFAGSVDVLVVDEAGQLSLANAVAVAPRRPGAWSCSAIRSSSTSRSRARIRPARRHRPSATSWARDATMPPELRPLPGADAAPPPGPLPLHLGGLLRGPARLGAGLERPGPRRVGEPLTGTGRALRPGGPRGQPQRVAGGGGRRGRPGPRARRSGTSTWTDEDGRAP